MRRNPALTVRWLVFVACLLLPDSAQAFQPSPTSPYTYSTPTSDVHSHIKVGDGFFHAVGCTPGGAPDYGCFCTIGAPGQLTSPKVSMSGTTLTVEYWILNAYCNPAGADPNRPNAQSYYIYVYSIDSNDNVSNPFSVIAPYWEHGQVQITGLNACSRYQAVLVISYLGCGSVCFDRATSKLAGPVGQDGNGRSCLAETRGCPVPISASKPINVGSGNMRYSETLFSVSENNSPLTFSISYNSRNTASGPLGIGFTHSFSQTLKPLGDGKRIQWTNGNGEKTIFYSVDPANVAFVPIWPADAMGSVTLSGGLYSLTELDGTVTTFGSTNGEWRSTTDRWGNATTGAYTGNNLTGLADPEARSWTLAYSGSQLISITDPDSHVWQFGYDGFGHLKKAADPFHNLTTPWRTYLYVTGNASEPTVLAQVTDDTAKTLEGHEYDTAGRATSSWSGDTTVTGGIPHPGANARDRVTFAYTSPTQTSVTTTIDTGNTIASVFNISAPAGRFLPSSIQGNCPSCGGGADDLQSFTWDASNHMLSKIVGNPGEQVETDYTYDSNGMVLTRTEAVSVPAVTRTTTYTYATGTPSGFLKPWPSFVKSMTEPSAAHSGSKVTTYTWGTTGLCSGAAAEACLITSVSGYLAAADASATTYTTVALFDSRHRQIEVDGPTSTNQVKSTYYADNDATLNRRGRLSLSQIFTSGTSHLDTSYDNYDIFGTARKVVDPNLVETDRTSDARGRVLTVKSLHVTGDPNEAADYTTTYTLDTRDRLTSILFPGGNRTQYEYEDGTNRLLNTIRADSTNKQQERLRPTLNTIGGKKQEDAQSCNTPATSCAAWTTQRTESFKYDTHNRLSEIDHPVPAGSKILYAYDSRGNLTGVQDENHGAANTIYTYDELNRLKTVTQKQTLIPGPDIVTTYGYDAHDNLISVTDPNANTTNYAYDDFRRVQSQTSPVTGTTTYAYDQAGNLVNTTDANGATTKRTFDWANRVLSARSTKGTTTEIVSWVYDDAVNTNYGRGRVATMTDPTGTTTYVYDRRGLLRSENRSIGGNSYATGYGYDSNGNRTRITYPSGMAVNYAFDFADRPLTASSTSPTATFVQSPGATYWPFGPEKTLPYGNGSTRTLTVDQRYRPTENKLVKTTTTVADYTYGLDSVGNITTITDATNSAYNRTFAYDDLNRLTTSNSGASLWGTASDNKYTYDAMGNMLSLKLGAGRTGTFNYLLNGSSKNLPKLNNVVETGTRNVTYDSAGNETGVGAATYGYSARNFLASGDGLSYAYDSRGLRSVVFFTGPTVTAISPTSAAQRSASYNISLTITGAGFVSGATVQIPGLTVAVNTVNATTITATGTVLPYSASIPSGLRDVVVTNSGTNTPAGVLPAAFDLKRFTDGEAADTLSPWFWVSSTQHPIITDGITTNGDTTQVFNKTVLLKRRDMSRYIIRARGETPPTPPVPCTPTYGDVPCADPDWGYIEQITLDGIASGCGSGNFCPDGNLTRGEMAKFIVRGLNQTPYDPSLCSNPTTFTDVPCGHTFWGAIERFYRDGITSGCGTGIYCPNNNVSRSEMAAFISKGWQYSQPQVAGTLPGRYSIYTPEMNLLSETSISPPGSHPILYEYVWFNGHPVAQVDLPATVHWTFTDHLGTPLLQTQSDGTTMFWRAEYEPYGRLFSLWTTDQHQPLRLPGQEAEELNVSTDGNGQTERSYNVFRWYRARWGRYGQADPVGVDGGTNLFAYVLSSPIGYADSLGLSCLSNWTFFWDWALERGPESRQYNPTDLAGGEVSRSKPATYMRQRFTAAGCRNLTNQGYGTIRAFFETFYRPCDTSFQVGGFIWQATNVGGCQVKYHVDNTASLKSLLYHIPGVPRKARGTGIPVGGNIYQTFEWTEKNPCLCCPDAK